MDIVGDLRKICMGNHWEKSLIDHISAKKEDIKIQLAGMDIR